MDPPASHLEQRLDTAALKALGKRRQAKTTPSKNYATIDTSKIVESTLVSLTRPPIFPEASKTTTLCFGQPLRSNSRAADSPANPAPTTTT